MKKLKMHTPEGTKDNIARIAELFPNCVTETKDDKGVVTRAIDFDQLRQELSDHIVDGPRERYHLDWPGKREALLAANAPIAKTLRPDRKESLDFDKTRNLFIEGDNLDALKLLQETYLNRVQLIYIDPPYNTGTDLVYDDEFCDDIETYFLRSNQRDDNGSRLVANTEANGRFHSDWLSMIYPRLKLARNLLADDGCIFISIDDGELATLMTVCDEVFGEQHFVGCITRATGTTTGQDAQKIGASLDYLLVYRRSEAFSVNGMPLDDADEMRFTDEDGKGKFSTLQMRKTGNADRREDRPSMYYAVTDPNGKQVFPIGPGGYESRWRFGRDTYEEYCSQGLIVWKDSRSGVLTPYVKYYLEGRTKQVSNLWDDLDGNKKGSIEARELFGAKVFDNPKPTALIKRILQVGMKADGIVMDFFAGSATTAHAVMQVNADDGGTRQHIMVQLPVALDSAVLKEKAAYEFCQKIGRPTNLAELSKERIRRAGKAIKDEAGLNADKLDIGFRVLRVDSSNIKDVYYQPDAVKQETLHGLVDNVKEDRTDEDLLFQVLLDWGVDLTLPITSERIQGKAVHFVDTNALAACFEPGIDEAFIKELAARKPLRAVFRDTGYGSDATKINVEQIFKLLSPGTEVKSI